MFIINECDDSYKVFDLEDFEGFLMQKKYKKKNKCQKYFKAFAVK